MKRMFAILTFGIVCAPFLVFAADKPYTLFTDPDRCPPCFRLEMDLTHGKLIDPKSDPRTGRRDPDTAVPNWRDFVDVQPWESSPDGGAPYFRDNSTGSKVTSYPYGIIDNYVKNYEETMREKMKEAAEKAAPKAVPAPKDLPATRGMPPGTPAPKLPNTITFSGVQPIDPKDPSKGFFVIVDGKKITFDKPTSEAYKAFLGNYVADPANAAKVTYDMSTVKPYGIKPRPLGDPALPPSADGPDTIIMPRLRPMPDTHLNPIITFVRTDPDGTQIFNMEKEEIVGVGKDGLIYKSFNYIIRVPVGTPMPIPRGAVLEPMPLPKPKDNLDGPPAKATEDAIQDAYKKVMELQRKMMEFEAEQNKDADEE